MQYKTTQHEYFSNTVVEIRVTIIIASLPKKHYLHQHHSNSFFSVLCGRGRKKQIPPRRKKNQRCLSVQTHEYTQIVSKPSFAYFNTTQVKCEQNGIVIFLYHSRNRIKYLLRKEGNKKNNEKKHKTTLARLLHICNIK